jgi:hypothetical protein
MFSIEFQLFNATLFSQMTEFDRRIINFSLQSPTAAQTFFDVCVKKDERRIVTRV